MTQCLPDLSGLPADVTEPPLIVSRDFKQNQGRRLTEVGRDAFAEDLAGQITALRGYGVPISASISLADDLRARAARERFEPGTNLRGCPRPALTRDTPEFSGAILDNDARSVSRSLCARRFLMHDDLHETSGALPARTELTATGVGFPCQLREGLHDADCKNECDYPDLQPRPAAG